jgi:MFS family permease
MALALCAASTFLTAAYLSFNVTLTYVFIGLFVLCLSTVNGPLFAAIQTLVPDHMRALAFALIYLFANLLGMGFGPLVVGALSDRLGTIAGVESLRWSLFAVAPGYLVSAWLLWRTGQTVSRDLASVSRV